MELSIQKWGNSAAVRLPTALLAQLKAALGDKLSVAVVPEGILLKPKKQVYTLESLVAQCDQNAPAPADLAAWNGMQAVGREAW
jgi:antitoxin ChpS